MAEDPLAAFLTKLKTEAPAAPTVPKPSGILLKAPPPEAAALDPFLRNADGTAIELNECAVEWQTGAEEVARILREFSSVDLKKPDPEIDFYALLKVPILASTDLIKKHYKKLSVLVHPDKCAHPGAQDAFHLVNTAYKELQKPQYRLRFRATLSEARVKLQRDIVALNKRRKKGEAVPAPWYSDDDLEEVVYSESDPRILNRLLEVSEEILQDRRERLEYAERVRKANLMYEILQHEEANAREYRADVELKQWKKRQDERVTGWRAFRDSGALKKLRVTSDTVLETSSRKERGAN